MNPKTRRNKRMCDICLSPTCPPGCPNAPEPPDIGKCAHCGGSIYVGEEFAVGTDIYHLDCLEDLTVSEWMDAAGMTTQIVTEDG